LQSPCFKSLKSDSGLNWFEIDGSFIFTPDQMKLAVTVRGGTFPEHTVPITTHWAS